MLAKFSLTNCSQLPSKGFFWHVFSSKGKEGAASIRDSPGRRSPHEGAADFAGAHRNCCFSQATSGQLIKHKITTHHHDGIQQNVPSRENQVQATHRITPRKRRGQFAETEKSSLGTALCREKKWFRFNKYLCRAKSRACTPLAHLHST